MKYLILNGNAAKAQEISERIWKLTVPDTSGNVTKYYTSHVVHPISGKVALMVPGEASQQTVDGETVLSFSDAHSVHPNADVDGIANILDAEVTTNEKAAIRGQLAAAKGGASSLLAFCMQTPSLANRLKTQEQMEADGWFPTLGIAL